MGVPTLEVGYIPALPRREDHEVHKGRVVALGGKIYIYICIIDNLYVYEQQYTGKVLLCCHGNKGYKNAPQYYIIRTLLIFS